MEKAAERAISVLFSFSYRYGQRYGRVGCRFGIRTDSVEGRIREDSGGFRAAPQGILLRIVQSVWAFRTYRNGFRIRMDSVESRILTDSDGFQDPKYGTRQPTSSFATQHYGTIPRDKVCHVF
jgi:hypothetical protein